MIRNYLTIAWRQLFRNKMYSLINIGGLAVGMTVVILIGLWVYDEVSYNHSHDNYKNIAQLYRHNIEPLEQTSRSFFGFPQPVSKLLAEKYDYLFKHVVIQWWDNDYTLRVGENNYIQHGQFISNGVIDMFSLKMLKGNAKSLDDPHAIILSESAARSLFGESDPVNQLVRINSAIDVQITGVYQDVAPNSIFGGVQFFGNFDGLKASDKFLTANENNWGNNACRILLQTADHISIEQASIAIADLYIKDTPNAVATYSKKYQTRMWLNPMEDWYLYSEFKDGYPAGGRISFVWLFATVGAFVLLLACINFMNLTTARNEKRAKEVGIRKAIGSMRSQLVRQFLGESFLVVLLSLIIALVMVIMLLPSFNSLADKQIRFPFTNIYFWIASTAFLLITSSLAGLYPAFYLSSFQPISVLKGSLRIGKYAALPRKLMVVLQVSVSVVLIIGTLIVYRQIQFTQERPVGYDREGLIRIPIRDNDFEQNKFVMRDELMAGGIVTDVAFASSPVTAIWDNWGGFSWKGKNPEAESDFTVTWVNEDYGKTIQWKLLDGRDFSRELASDAEAVIINKAAADFMNLSSPIGEVIKHYNQERIIIGVVDDVVANSPYESVAPGFYWIAKDNIEHLGQMIVRIKPGSINEALSGIEKLQHKIVAASPFEYHFVDEEYGEKFKAEQLIGKLASVFATLAIFISCLGLFGLSSFIAEQKTKEIGVRKVVGASLFNVWSLLSREFIVLVVIAFVIAIPAAYYYLNQWLLTYQYHTNIDPLLFIYSGGSVVLITLVTVSFHSIKAAMVNPVKSLREN